MRKPFILFIICAIVCGFSSTLTAQENGQNSGNSSNFNINQVNPLNQPVYIDSYGLELLRQNLGSESAVYSSSYVLGTNDLLSIELKGTVSSIMRGLAINANGALVIPSVGTVQLENKTLSEARQAIQQMVDDKFQDTEIVLTLDQARPLNIHMTGQIKRPGKYSFPAQTRLNQALIHAFKPSTLDTTKSLNNSGSSLQVLMRQDSLSLRNIIIQHKNGSTDTADVIRYYLSGDVFANPFLTDGDVVRLTKVNASSPTVSISGAINYTEVLNKPDVPDQQKVDHDVQRQQLEVEYRHDDTVKRLIKMAGGLRFDAAKDHLFIVRLTDSGIKKLKINRQEFSNVRLKPFDRIIVPYQTDIRESGSVSIFGEVAYPGNYPIKKGSTTVFELLQVAGGLNEEALPQAAYMIRNNNDEQILTEEINEDRLKRASDQVMEGYRYLEMEARLSEGRVFIDLSKPEQLKNVTLIDGDQLFVPQNENTVFVFGQVNNPGFYTYNNAARLTPETYIERAGGMTIAANMERVFVIKAGNKTWMPGDEATVEPGDMVFVDRVPFENVAEQREFELRKRQLKNSSRSIILSGLATVASVITTIFAITNNN